MTDSVEDDGALSRKSKADLLALIGEQREQLRRADNRAVAEPVAPRPMPEAVALEACMRALNEFVEAERRTRNSNTGYGYPMMMTNYDGSSYRQHGPVERILRHLADTHNVPLVETQYADCPRRHVDEVQPQAILDALHSSPRVSL